MRYKVFDNLAEALQAIENRSPRLLHAGGVKVCIYRNGTHFFACKDECPHAGGQLHKGTVNSESEIVCPLHAYRFNPTDGQSHHQKCTVKFYKIVWIEQAMFIEI